MTSNGPTRWHPKGLLLDFGAVISVSIFERHRQSEALLGLPQGSLAWAGPLDPRSDELWQSMQRDEITEREYYARRAAEVGELVGESGWTTQEFLRRVRQAEPDQVVRPQMEALISHAREAGIELAILSNELELFYGPKFLSQLSVLQHMKAVVDATHTQILKPDPRAYAMAVAAMGLQADEILFVDDQFRNIAGAVRAGLQTQFFDLRDVPGNIAAIRARLELPKS